MESGRILIGKCGIHCGSCRLCVLKKCNGCSTEEMKCPYLKCLENNEVDHCGECTEFPCEKHYGPMAVYAKKYLDWKRQEIVET